MRSFRSVGAGLPLTHSASFLYDGNSNLVSATDRNGHTATYSYDPLNRIFGAGYADSVDCYTWDSGNRLTGIAEGGPTATCPGSPSTTPSSVVRVYDDLDRLKNETTTAPSGTAVGSVAHTYDKASRLHTTTVSGQAQISYTFDPGNRLTQIVQGTATVGLGYDTANRRTSLTLPNTIVASYGYDSASQLRSLSYNLGSSSGTLVGSIAYTYDLAGQQNSRTGNLSNTKLPDAVTSAAYNADNQLTSWTTASGTVTPAYDLNGNLTCDNFDAATAACIGNPLTWDARNRLTQFDSPAAASFGYDAASRRLSVTPVGGTAATYLYDGLNPVQITAGGTTTNLLNGLGIDERFTATTGSTTSTYLADIQGTIQALTDSTGTIQTRYNYQPYGTTTTSGTASGNTFQFTGRENDVTGLYFYRARYYNPAWGRFVSQDPLGVAAGPNVYAYVGNDPINNNDPTGQFGFVGFGIGAFAGAIAGYETGGWRGAVIGAVVGGIVGIAAPEVSSLAATSAAGFFGSEAVGVAVGAATFSAVNGAAGGGAAIATNLAEGNPTFSDVTTSVAIGALAPFASGESALVGLGGAAEVGLPGLADYTFSTQTGIFGALGAAGDVLTTKGGCQ